ncbi:MAG: fasciclin domain-containing protein [Owenweeksia sp.]|nr:fasciclin domain-containing protein [Owenweeksia sp.]
MIWGTFYEAMELTGLASEFNNQSFTVLAPVDKVFKSYLTGLGVSDVNHWVQVYGEKLVKNVLRYHIIKGPAINAQHFSSSYLTTMATDEQGNGLSLFAQRKDTLIKLNNYGTITQMNLQAENGVIHKINQVLNLPSLPILLEVNPEFSQLRKCFQSANGNINTLLRQENSTYTLFAPTNRAFKDLFDNNPSYTDYYSFASQNSASQMRDIMLFHLLPKKFRSSALNSNKYTTELNGKKLTIVKDSMGNISLTDSNGNSANIIITDITAINGIMHSLTM